MNSPSSLLDLELVAAELQSQVERLRVEKMKVQQEVRTLSLSRQRR